MDWKKGNVCVQHPRSPWPTDTPEILVHCRYDAVKGTSEKYGEDHPEFEADYAAAKWGFDFESAADIVERCLNESVLDDLAEIVLAHLDIDLRLPVIVFPHPSFDDDEARMLIAGGVPVITNAIPFTFASILSRKLGITVSSDIIQAGRVGRSKLNTFLRFLCQPSFEGEIEQDRSYILIDDVATTGGTLAALFNYISGNGGLVVALTSLSSPNGKNLPLAIASNTSDVLNSLYGDGFGPYWQETVGHGTECLTEVESRKLVEWGEQVERRLAVQRGDPLLHKLRERINKAAAKGG